MASSGEALSLKWAFGYDKSLPSGAQSLCDATAGRYALFYAAAHTGVIYDCVARTQRLLQGHCNAINAIAVSQDKRFIVTADAGRDSLLVVWDSATGTPVKTLFQPHPHGVAAVDLSADATVLATLSAVAPAGASVASGSTDGDATAAGETEGAQQPATLSLWAWTAAGDEPVATTTVPADDADAQLCVKFNPHNPRELVTNSSTNVLFWNWDANGELLCIKPYLSRRDFQKAVTGFTVSSFVPGGARALTCTDDGNVVLWDAPPSLGADKGGGAGGKSVAGDMSATGTGTDDLGGTASLTGPEPPPTGEKVASKVIQLSEKALRQCVVIGKYLALAGDDGTVRFYDFEFRLEAWFEDMEAGPIHSISFAADATGPPKDGPALDFWVPDFMVGTGRSLVVGMEAYRFEEIDAANRRGTPLVQGMAAAAAAVATHPLADRLVIACHDGGLYLWDYAEKVLLLVRVFDAKLYDTPCSAAFSPSGDSVAVGFANGTVKVVRSDTLDDVITLKPSGDTQAITKVTFSHDGNWLAAADSAYHVAVWNLAATDRGLEAPPPTDDEGQFEVDEYGMPVEAPATKAWAYLGRHRSHTAPVTGLDFGKREDGAVALVSVGEDRTLVEYDLAASSFEAGLVLKDGAARPIEQSAVPTACMWHPLLDGDFEDRIVTANSEFKLKQWNADNKSCRRTSLGPTFGGPITRLTVLPTRSLDAELDEEGMPMLAAEPEAAPAPSPYAAYATAEKVVGVLKMPLDGNPNKMMGLIAHPGEVASIAVTRDGRYLVTAGGADMTVNMWEVDAAAIDAAEAGGGEGVEAFVGLLEGGHGGELHEELMDYFYYAQLRTHGERTTKQRELTGDVPLEEVPNLVRALGFYPSEADLANMIQEVKYSEFTQTGAVRTSVRMDEFVRLYVNHRPVFGVGKEQIEAAFVALGAQLDGGDDGAQLSWADLAEVLKTTGDAMSEDELAQCLAALTGDERPTKPTVTAGEFVADVLGFAADEAMGGEQQ